MTTVLPREEILRVVGTSLRRVDAIDKVTEFAQYTGDIRLPGMLHAKLLRSPHAHACILSIDTKRAERIQSVKAIVSHKDVPRIRFNSSCPVQWNGNFPLDQTIFDDKVRFAGEPVAAIAADDVDTAEEALATIKVRYKAVPFVLDSEAALGQGAPRVHDVESNIFFELNQASGDFDRALAASDFIFRGRYSTSSVQHCAMEPHVCVCKFEGGKLTVWASTQIPFRLRTWLSRVLGLPVGKVRVIQLFIGGGFGGKEEMTVEPYCALLAMKTGKPVMLEYTRAEEFIAGRRRHSCIMDLETGVNKKGFIIARGMKSILQAGAYASHAPIVLGVVSEIFQMMYKAESVRFDGKCVYTNTTPGGAYRGYGATQPVFAVERQVDEICRELNFDPLDFRLKNSYSKGDVDPVTGWTIASGANQDCLRIGAEKIGWNKMRNRTVKHIRTGIGVARYIYPTGARPHWPESSEAQAIMNEDGSVSIVTSAVDLGTGISTGLVQIAAEELRVTPDKIIISLGSDTDTSPFDLGTYASRVTFVAGGAVRKAAADAKNKLMLAASRILETELAQLDTDNGYVYVNEQPSRRISFGEIVTACRYAIQGATSIIGKGFHEPMGNAPAFGAQFAEVEVDLNTGRTKVVRIVAALDVGKAINPSNIEGQVHGSIQMGLGFAISECLNWDKSTGEVLNSSFLDYKIFTAPDMPKIDVIILESPDPSGPYGAKGVGEQAILPTAAAIANAINDAVGISIRDLPLTSEKLYRRLQSVSLRSVFHST